MAAEKLGSVSVIGPRGVEDLQEWGSLHGLSIEIFTIRPRLYVVGSADDPHLTESEQDQPFPGHGAIATVSLDSAIEVGSSMFAPPDWLKDNATVVWGRTDQLAVRTAVHRHLEKYPPVPIDSSALPANVVPLQRLATAS